MTQEIDVADPFGVTADPAGYMPRVASERALAGLERSVLAGAGVTVLCGPPGIGKTLLLRVLETRLGGRLRTVYLPYAALRFEELCAWALGLLGEAPAPGASPAEALRALAERAAADERPLLLLIDDAHAMPSDAAARLSALVSASAGALRLVASGPDEPSADAPDEMLRWFAALGTPASVVTFDQPMSAAETALFVRARLERAAVEPAQRARFDGALIDRLHRRAAGIPRVIQGLAGEVLRRGEAALPRDPLEDLLAAEGIALPAARRDKAPLREPRVQEAETPVAPIDAVPPVVPVTPASPPPAPRPAAAVTRPPPWVATPEAPAAPAPTRAPAPPPAAPAPSAPPRVVSPQLPAAPAEPSPRPEVSAPPATLQRPPPIRLEAPPHWLGIFLVVAGIGLIALSLPILRSILAAPTPKRDAIVAPVVAPQPAPVPPEPNALPAPPAEPKATATRTPPAPPDAVLPPSAKAEPVAPAREPVSVHVNATPWATVSVDGVDLGETPIAGVPLLPGPHRFQARMPDGRVIERTVEVDASRRHVSFE